MERFEYKILLKGLPYEAAQTQLQHAAVELESALNRLGALGWEAVGTGNDDAGLKHVLLKRRRRADGQ